DPGSYPWRCEDYRPPEFRDLQLYQFHFGTYWGVDAAGEDTRLARTSRFLDLLYRIEYLHDLGINAIQPLPMQEYPTAVSMGYNGTDHFSPEMDYQAEDPAALERYLEQANRLLARRGAAPLGLEDIRPGPNQLK